MKIALDIPDEMVVLLEDDPAGVGTLGSRRGSA
jgi:hypothetical protein